MTLASLVAVPRTCVWNPSIAEKSVFCQPIARLRVLNGVRKKAPGLVSNAPAVSSFRGFASTRTDWTGGNWAIEDFGYSDWSKESETRRKKRHVGVQASASNLQETLSGIMEGVKWGWTASPPTWEAAFISVGSIFVVAAPALLFGLTKAGIVSAYLLGSIIWRAYGGQGLLTIVLFYLIMGFGSCFKARHVSPRKVSSSAPGTGATKLKLKEKQKEGIAEKRSGRRGPASVWGSGTAGAICAIFTIYGVGGPEFSYLWQLGYLASLCTKLSDTISSEIGKAYGKTTYLVTTFSQVPRGTEGAVSLEGTLAGLIASIFLAAASYALNQVDSWGAIIAVVASQLANLVESFLGATLQGRRGYEWLSNDIVNVINVSVGAALAILAKKYLCLA